MREIIDSKLYDTETSNLVGKADNGYGPAELKHAEYWLYKKRNGKYWLYGEGNAMSDCAQYNKASGSWEAGTKITPLSFEEAKKWAEKYQDDIGLDTYMHEFGAIKKDPTQVAKTLTLTQYIFDELERLAQEEDKTKTELLTELISKQYTKKHGDDLKI